MLSDILFSLTPDDYYDITFNSWGDFTLTQGFETALAMSVFCEQKASASEVPKIELRRGWWGNKVGDFDNYEIGSKLWLLEQARNTLSTLNLTKTYAANCLQWMVDDGHIDKIDVDANFIVDGINISVTLYRMQNIILSTSYELWENTNKF